MNNIIKEKYVIINEENRILLFELPNRFIVPSICKNPDVYDNEEVNRMHEKVLNICLEDNLSKVHTRIFNNPEYIKDSNNKIVKISRQYITYYYVLYKKFTEQDYIEINNLASESGIIPHMATVEEVYFLIRNKKIDKDIAIVIKNITNEFSRKNRKR